MGRPSLAFRWHPSEAYLGFGNPVVDLSMLSGHIDGAVSSCGHFERRRSRAIFRRTSDEMAELQSKGRLRLRVRVQHHE